MSVTQLNGGTIDRATLRSNHSNTTNTVPGVATHRKRRCCDVHCNNLWSIWYGLCVVSLEAFVVYKCVSRFLLYLALPWPDRKQPYLELNLFVGLVGAGVVLLPFYFISFMFKIGNLANDGYKLGFQLSACAMDPPSVLAQSSGFIRNAWHHGGPTAPFIHLVSSFCFIIPKVFIEAKLIEVGFLAKEKLWKTDLDWLIPHQDRMVILHFLTGGTINATASTTPPPFHHPAAQIREYLDAEDTWWPCSPEFINYTLALLVYSVRYPAVFWNTNKGFAFLFSLQLLANGLQNLLALGGISIMYKVQMLGPQNVLHKYEPFLLNTPICMLLYSLSCIIVTMSSCVLYMYGYQKFMAFIALEREKNNVVLREGKTSLWSYFSHCAAMCVLIALAVCNGPLLYDYTLVYKGSLDGTVLACVIGTILHLFIWIVVWLFLTVKQQWSFKLRVTIGRSMVKSARSIKLVNDIDLADHDSESMLIVAFGKTFSVTDSGPKKLIMNTLARAAIERDRALDEPGEEDRLLLTQSPNTATLARQKKTRIMASTASGISPQGSTSGGAGRPKVTFHEDGEMASNSPRPGSSAAVDICSPRLSSRPRREEEMLVNVASINQRQSEDDCDELPPPPGHCEGAMTSPNGGQIGSRLVVSPRPTIQQKKNPMHDVQELHTPRSNRSVDSGLPHDDITPRSESLSTASSASPPDQSQHGHHHNPQSHTQLSREMQQQHRKSTSLDDINLNGGIRIVTGAPGANTTINSGTNTWKTYSLQRGSTAPTSENAPNPNASTNNAIYASTTTTATNKGGGPDIPGTVVIRNRIQTGNGTQYADDEDPYGRCMNMKLTSFADGGNPQQSSSGARDPRIIDLNSGGSQNGLNQVTNGAKIQMSPRTGSPVAVSTVVVGGSPTPHHQNFNTLPAHVNGIGGSGTASGGTHGKPPMGPAMAAASRPLGGANNNANTLPARVAANGVGPTGRHFKPFDHRRMNPMAEIQEDPYSSNASCGGTTNSNPVSNPYGTTEPIYSSGRSSSASSASNSGGSGGGNLIVQKSTQQMPHMPSEVRHTNYQQRKPQMINPHILEHRDSANFSLASSSDSA